MNKKKILSKLDQKLNNSLIKNVTIMPKRWQKMIAFYYADARVRKIYLEELHVHMGKGTYANLGLSTDATEENPVYIGANVSIAPNVTFITESEPNNGVDIKRIPEVAERLVKHGEIVIEDDVWIGEGVTILPGVTVGKCVVIGAGAVVTSDLEANSIYAGIPAKKIRDLGIEKGRYNDGSY